MRLDPDGWMWAGGRMTHRPICTRQILAVSLFFSLSLFPFFIFFLSFLSFILSLNWAIFVTVILSFSFGCWRISFARRQGCLLVCLPDGVLSFFLAGQYSSHIEGYRLFTSSRCIGLKADCEKFRLEIDRSFMCDAEKLSETC